jgi:hypothetical protein
MNTATTLQNGWRTDHYIYVRRPDLGYDGDTYENEWCIGFSVHLQPDVMDPFLNPWRFGRFPVYTDDGMGNGDFMGTFPSIAHALQWMRSEDR